MCKSGRFVFSSPADFRCWRSLALAGKEAFLALKKRLRKVGKERNWSKRLLLLRSVSRDYNLAVSFDVLSLVPWRVWGEKKRHRTVPMVVDSIYSALKEGKFSLPPSISKKKELREKWLARIEDSLNCYYQLLDLGIKPREAIFIIPRAIYLRVLQRYDLYNLLLGYYPLRLCSTAEEEMLRLTEAEVKDIKRILKQKGIGWLGRYIQPKCHFIGFCPEKNFCLKIRKSVPAYNQRLHQKMHAELEKRVASQSR